MAFFDFVTEFINDNEKEIKAAADGAAAVWSIGSRLAGIAADMAVDTAKEAYASLTEEEEPAVKPAESKAPESTDAADDLKSLTKELKELMRQNEALQRRLEELEAEKEAMEEQSCLDAEIGTEDYYNSLYPEDEEAEVDEDASVWVYENTSQREVVVKLAGFGEACTVQAMNYLLNKYSSGVTLPWVKVDGNERCVTIMRPEGGFAYIGDDSVEEIL